MPLQELCPCCSGMSYDTCCRPFHRGAIPEHAKQLMRARYSAYAKRLPNYVIQTTHSSNPQYSHDTDSWRQDIEQFSESSFCALHILQTEEHIDTATVTFTAHISYKGRDASFTEKSFFKKINAQWIYISGDIIEPPL